ncbi:MAG: NAD(+) synthase [Proteobacteria bacterium]|jgi:NAD+ synthase (glutamine-hydrolysing)|uniref:Glutamine-dependent NAD(+) synthetase n=2 Tax=Hyphomicrobiales TaxID=356 RepID=A0A1C2DCR7_9HYPH|nr:MULTISPECIES: NAD(+) synthase [Hyphomicrobiales]MCA0276211.1 NAD(+) synthase [Pseudomonadota bacterium]ODT73864.1 MAG: NAD(+) synthase [Pelagibacterium sp. SCN 64-44]QOD64878.1 NAD(+) synthase [Ochrobactrum sp. MT180101]RTL91026.1 NAD(+) synthase [Ancylobacter aquaticus]MAU23697.1 NAD(+) synthase [Martelella sp.]|tara:strand:- start:745 stop:2790 length:2046 start_codon:yes stop_codon:yes gene_type:complete
MSFYSIYQQGFVRVAACTPKCEVADPSYNVAETLALARDGARQGVALMVFPELGLCGYAIDDLLGQAALLQRVEQAIEEVAAASRELSPVLLIGAPLVREGRLYNCAVAVHRGRILGVVPKGHLPNYREFYEKRWFASGRNLKGATIEIAGQSVPFGMDMIFAAEDLPGFVFHVELCEDVWGPAPPSDFAALAGALILTNLSASNITVGKAETRRLLCATQSARCWAAYIYSAAGPGESTTDLAWDGQACIYELGQLLAETERFPQDSQMAIADVDVDRLRLERLRTGTFNEAAIAQAMPEDRFRRIGFRFEPSMTDLGLRRAVARFPYAPADPARLDQDCYEAYSIQVQGLMKRLQATGIRRVCIGVSGGLDSTHALIVAAKAFDRLGWPRSDILGFTMPGFATGEATKANAWTLMRSLGVTAEEIDIKPLAQQMLASLQHPFAQGEPVYDVTFENVQAGLRTDILFRAANQRGAMVLGTGDLSEIALGWSTYGVGDHMSHYNVNASVPKTLIQHLIRWVAQSAAFDEATNGTLLSILDTVISPELVPAGEGGALQSTEEKIGPYELQDFTLFYLTRYGLKPSKIAFLAFHAWRDATAGAWPPQYPEERRRAYDLPTIRSWMEVFLYRFFTISQFKRSASPNGPKVTAGGSLSPRGDWRAPSDGNARLWLEELRAHTPSE